MSQLIVLICIILLHTSAANFLDNRLCQVVCLPCGKYLSIRYSALCQQQCYTGGQAFDACLMMFTLINGHGDTT